MLYYFIISIVLFIFVFNKTIVLIIFLQDYGTICLCGHSKQGESAQVGVGQVQGKVMAHSWDSCAVACARCSRNTSSSVPSEFGLMDRTTGGIKGTSKRKGGEMCLFSLACFSLCYCLAKLWQGLVFQTIDLLLGQACKLYDLRIRHFC